MNFSRQALLGIGMIIGGSVMLYAMVQQIGASNNQEPTSAMVDKPTAEQEMSQPLTTDIDTEKRILAQKQKERVARVAEQEKRAKQFLTEQEVAETQALAKAKAENQRYIENSTPTANENLEVEKSTMDAPQGQPRTDNTATNASATTTNVSESDNSKAQKVIQDQQKEATRQAVLKKQAEAKKLADNKAQAELKKKAEAQVAAEQKKQAEAITAIEAAKKEPPKSPTDYTVKSGDGLLRLARQYNMSVEALAQANNLSPSASLQLGQTLNIPSRKQVDRLEREAATAQQAREEKRKKQEALASKSAETKREAQKKLSEARKEVKETDAKGSFGVQVALANNQTTADEMAKKFQAAGYQVKTSATSRGVRVVVGPERGKIAALALKDKINSDPKVNTTSAWVLYWR